MSGIEKIKAEIERLKKILEESTYYLDKSQQALGYSFALDDFKEFIDSLPDEKPSEDLPTSDEEMAKFLATHPKVEVPEKYKTPNWLFDKQLSEDLEEAAQEYAIPFNDTTYGCEYSYKGFIAGAKWQAKQLFKGSPLPEDTVLFQKGVEEGRRLEKDELALTCEDMAKIDAIILDVNNEFAVDYTKEIDRQKFYEEVLKRFEETKK